MAFSVVDEDEVVDVVEVVDEVEVVLKHWLWKFETLTSFSEERIRLCKKNVLVVEEGAKESTAGTVAAAAKRINRARASGRFVDVVVMFLLCVIVIIIIILL